jgi:hypothetical protein
MNKFAILLSLALFSCAATSATHRTGAAIPSDAVVITQGGNFATVTAGGALSVTSSPGGTSPSVSTQIATVSGAVKASAATLYSAQCNNRNAANRWLHIDNLAAAPGGGTVPTLAPILEPAGGMVILGTDFFTTSGVAFSVGIAFGHSTTSGTYTAATAGDHDCTFLFQ